MCSACCQKLLHLYETTLCTNTFAVYKCVGLWNKFCYYILWREGTDHVYSACKCWNQADHVPNDLSEWIKFRTLQLVSVSCSCYVSALLHICLVWVIQIPKRMFFYLFYLWARELKLVPFLPNFDVIRTKEAGMEPVYKTCFGRGNNIVIV